MTKRLLSVLLCCAMLMMLTGCAGATDAVSSPTPKATATAAAHTVPTAKPAENAAGMPLVPDFELPRRGGEMTKLSDQLGKQVVLYFWASWCGPCQASMPEKQELYNLIAERKLPIEFMAINQTDGQRETRATCDAFLDENQYTFPVYYDETGVVSAQYGISGIPTVIVVDEQGYLKGGAIGGVELKDLYALLGVTP